MTTNLPDDEAATAETNTEPALANHHDTLKALIARLTPRALAILLGLSIMSLAIVQGFAVYEGMGFSLTVSGFKVEPVKTGNSEADQQQIAALEAVLQSQPDIEELAIIFKRTDLETWEDLRPYLAWIQEREENHVRYRRHHLFKLFLLEYYMGQNGGPIDTREGNRSDSAHLEIILEVLRPLGFTTESEVTRESAFEAIKAYQIDWNKRLEEIGEKPVDEKYFGLLGRRTLESIRSYHAIFRNNA